MKISISPECNVFFKYSKTLKINRNNFFKLLIQKLRQNLEIVLLKMYTYY